MLLPPVFLLAGNHRLHLAKGKLPVTEFDRVDERVRDKLKRD